MAISGTAVAAATIGGFLVYAGIKDVELTSGLREIVGGKTPTGRPQTPTADFTSAGVSVGQTAGSVAAIASGGGNKLVAAARTHLGAKYVFASVGPTTFDCSGLVVYCLRQIGYNGGKVPRFITQSFAAWARSQGWAKLDVKNAQAGDVLLKSGHMAIAVGGGRMIHAPHTGSYVKDAPIYTPMYMWSAWRMPADWLKL
jgi:cell wall-associated NlpC family hydrolase